MDCIVSHAVGSLWARQASWIGRGIAQMVRAGLYRPVQSLSPESASAARGEQPAYRVLVLESILLNLVVNSGANGNLLLGPSLTAFEPKRSFGGFHSTCLSALVTDRAMEAWYHPSIA